MTQSGIYLYDDSDGSLTVAADESTSVPGGSGNFTGFSTGPETDGGQVLLWGVGPSPNFPVGLYLFDKASGRLDIVADASTPIPEGTGTFSFFSGWALDENKKAFTGEGADGQQGIYLILDDTLYKVIDLTDTLDGKQIALLDTGTGSLSGTSITFFARFADGSEGIYLASPVPIPGALPLLGSALAGFGFMGWRRRERV